jgi:hypothetical protein
MGGGEGEGGAGKRGGLGCEWLEEIWGIERVYHRWFLLDRKKDLTVL